MFWQTTQEKEALASFRADRRLREELIQDLHDFQIIYWDPTHPDQKVWASHMIKSIEHELYQLGA